nr:META domain-containing protein [Acidithiobacillus sp.]
AEVDQEKGTYQWNTAGSAITLRDAHGQVSHYRVIENALVKLDQQGQTISLMNGPQWQLHKVSEDSEGQLLYESFRWQAQYVEGASSLAGSGGKVPYIAFIPSSQKIVGWDGCNQISGNFTLGSNHGLKFGPLISTRKACMGLEVDRHVAQVLNHTHGFRVHDSTLQLLGAKGKVIARFGADAQPLELPKS